MASSGAGVRFSNKNWEGGGKIVTSQFFGGFSFETDVQTIGINCSAFLT